MAVVDIPYPHGFGRHHSNLLRLAQPPKSDNTAAAASIVPEPISLADYVSQYVEANASPQKHEAQCCSEAIDSAYKNYFPVSTDATRMPIFKALYDCFKRKDGSHFTAHFGHERKVSLQFDHTHNPSAFSLANKELCVNIKNEEMCVLPETSGKWKVCVKTASLGSGKFCYEGHYDLSSMLKTGTNNKVCIYRIPLYAESALEAHLTKSIPVVEMSLKLKVQAGVVSLLGLKVCCWIVPNRHSLLYTPEWSLEETPTLMPFNNCCTTSSSNINQKHCMQYLSALCKDAKFSLSVNHAGRRAISFNGAREHRFGSISELFLALAAIQKTASENPGQVEEALSSNEYLCSLLQRTPHLYEAIQGIYKRADTNLPCLFDLLTGTSGLPDRPSLEWDLYDKLLPSAHQLKDLLGGKKVKDVDLAELLRLLHCRTLPFAQANAIVQHSVLASCILKHCIGSENNSEGWFERYMLEHCFRGLGLTNTYYASQNETDVNHELSLGQHEQPYKCALGLVSTTDDLSTYLCQLWRNCDACNNPSAPEHAYLAFTAMPRVAVSAGQDRGLHSMCNGSYEHIRLNLPLSHGGNKEMRKCSFAVMFKFGEIAGTSCSVVIMVPALELQVCIWMPISAATLFSTPKSKVVKSYNRPEPEQQTQDAGRFHLKKFLKHTILSLIYDEQRGMPHVENLNIRCDIAFSGTPKIPSSYERWIAAGMLLESAPSPKSLHGKLFANPPFVKQLFGVSLLSFSAMMGLISRAKYDAKKTVVHRIEAASLVKFMKEHVSKNLSRIRKISICQTDASGFVPYAGDHILEYDFVIRDHNMNEEWALAWESRAPCPSTKETGAFRIMSNQNQSAGECVFIHLLHDPSCKRTEEHYHDDECHTPVVVHGGEMYVAAHHFEDIITDIANHIEIIQKRDLQMKSVKQSAQHMPWREEEEEKTKASSLQLQPVKLSLRTKFTRFVYARGGLSEKEWETNEETEDSNKREPVERGIGWGGSVALGALGGAAIVGATAAPYGYGGYGYYGPNYPYGPRWPHYWRRYPPPLYAY